MYKNQLQELAQRSCFNLPSYACIREGPDHAPRFKATVNFNGETFESPSYCSTLRQAEHSAAEVALNALASRGPSNSLAARILDETGVYKNLLQEVSQRVGASLPAYTTFRSGLGHLPIFTCTVELAGIIFTGEPAKNKKQAEKNAAMAAWLSLKSLVQQFESSTSEKTHKDEQEHVTVTRALQKYLIQAIMAKLSFPIKFPTSNPRSSNTQQPTATSSKILPLICPRAAPRNKPIMAMNNKACPKTAKATQSQPIITSTNESSTSLVENHPVGTQKFPAAGAAPYIPVRRFNPHHRIAPPVTIRNAIPVFSAPAFPPPQTSLMMGPPPLGMAPPVCIRQAVPVFAAAPVRVEELPMLDPTIRVADPRISRPPTIKVGEPSSSKFSLVRAEDPPVSKAGRLDESQLSKVPLVRIEEPLGSKLQPVHVEGPLDSEVLAVGVDPPVSQASVVQVESPVSMVIGPSANSKAPAEETKTAAQDNLQESAEIEGFKELKI
ncbi:Double-stranded RNA-binding protein 2 [Abeliophyllum distichum]|uniref:Double-stranded RNA-binding protein 2 n=1 Tax=Abeliophyllum distichum TaxID=126358 RepID=A0ABD1VQY9_9LAMI